MHRNKKLSLYEEVLNDVDTEIYLMVKRIAAHYNIRWKDARDLTNKALRQLMCSFPEE